MNTHQARAAAIALACALCLPAVAQTSSSTTVTTTTGQSPSSTMNIVNGNTSISGGTGDGTVSSSGVVIDPAADQALLGEVVSALAADPAIAGAVIDVQVVGGRVTLNGATRDMTQTEAAKEIAQGIAGAANVASNLASGRL